MRHGYFQSAKRARASSHRFRLLFERHSSAKVQKFSANFKIFFCAYSERFAASICARDECAFCRRHWHVNFVVINLERTNNADWQRHIADQILAASAVNLKSGIEAKIELKRAHSTSL